MVKKVRSSWSGRKVYDWKNYLIPARPSPSELHIVEQYLAKLQKLKPMLRVAILGSTVEFRSLCHRYSADVTLIEFSRKHFQILSRQPMKFEGREKLREEDWRAMATEEKYDLILGDLALNVVARKDMDRILRNLSSSLADGGHCILRTWVRSASKKYDSRTVIAQHRRYTPHTHFWTACVLPLHMCSYDFKRDRADYPAMIETLGREYRAGAVSKDEYQYCRDRWKNEGSAFSIPKKSVMTRLKARYFRIAAIRFGTDCFRRWAPIYVLRRKCGTSMRTHRRKGLHSAAGRNYQ